MDDESSTPSDLPAEWNQALEGVVVQSRAEAAYELKLSGSTLQEIADKLGYASRDEAARAMANLMQSQASFLTTEERTALLRMENDRLDRLLSKVWPSAMTGDPRSVEAALKITDRRIKINHLDAIDTNTQQHTVLVIGGAEEDYVRKLKELGDD